MVLLSRQAFHFRAMSFGKGARSKGVRLFAVACAMFATLAPDALESAAANGDTRTLFLFHSHSKEAIAATFRTGGHYDGQVLEKLNWFLRDWRTDEPTHMDPRLFDTLWEAYRSAGRNTGPDDPIVVVSAYRCPATNAMLRRRSSAVAEHSQHMLGKAMDSTMPAMSMEKLREIAMRMQRGGVGYYPNANTPFVHIDVGGVRHWPRMNYDQLVRLFPDGKTVHIPSNGHPLPGYEEARADIIARGGEAVSVADATSNGGGIFGFFARLFGGGADEAEDREVAPEPKATKLASRGRRAPAAQQAPEPSRQMVASAEADLPRGETYFGAPAAQAPASVQPPAPQPPAPQRQPVAAAPPEPTPQPVAVAPKPEPEVAAPETAPQDDPATTVAAPLPPRRPTTLASLEAPLPPIRPAELGRLPDVITHGAPLGAVAGAHSGGAAITLAYAAPATQADKAMAPLPPPRPAMPPLRAAALGKAEEFRAAKSVAAQMAPARVDRGALKALAAPAPALQARPPVSGGVAPPLRAAAKRDVLTGHESAKGVATGFKTQATSLSPIAFNKKVELDR